MGADIMPSGETPVYTPTIIQNETNTKVYFRTSAVGEWQEDKSLIFLGRTGVTNGYSFGGARFYVLETDNDTTRTGQPDEVASRQYNASVKYRCNFSGGYVSPYYVKVVLVQDELEATVFVGFINSVDLDLTGERATANALTFSALLDQQQIYGGWRKTAGTEVAEYYFNHVLTYNPNGIGNKSDKTYTIQGYTVNATDDSLIKDDEADANKFTVLDMIYTVWARVNGQLDARFAIAPNPWQCFKNIYGRQDNLVITLSAQDKLDASYAVNNYKLQGKTIWGALAELVESVAGLAITEDIDSDGEPYVNIIDLKGDLV